MITGKYKVTALQDNTMKADGGLVFGAIPKTEWSHYMHSDEKNRVNLGINQLLIQANKLNILVDTGIGNKFKKRHREILGIKSNLGIIKELADIGLSPLDITHVILTHLHYDHSGGLTKFSENGEEVLPVFKNAEYIIQKDEWKTACNPDDTSRLLYKYQDFLPINASKKLNFIKGNANIADSISVMITGGHTASHQMVILEDSDARILFPADICPTQFHLAFTSREAFDLYPSDTLQARKLLIKKALRKDSYIVFSHSESPDFFKLEGDFNHPKIIKVNDS